MYFLLRQASLYPTRLYKSGQNKGKSAENAKEAIQGYIAALREDNLAIPEDKFDAVLVAAKYPNLNIFHAA